MLRHSFRLLFEQVLTHLSFIRTHNPPFNTNANVRSHRHSNGSGENEDGGENDHHHHNPHDDAGSLSRSASESSVAQAHIENGLNINNNGYRKQNTLFINIIYVQAWPSSLCM